MYWRRSINHIDAALVLQGQNDSRVTVQNEEPDAGPHVAVNRFRMNDAKGSEVSCLKGFYSIENGWRRWTAGTFTVHAAKPRSAAGAASGASSQHSKLHYSPTW